jgi:hypothetical protein
MSSTANLQQRPLWILSIHDRSPDGVLSFDLKDILRCLGPSIHNYSWLITELDCTGEDTERICESVEKSSNKGLAISADDLLQVSQRILQTIDATIIGMRKKEPNSLNNGFTDLEHFPHDDTELIIRAIDSSFFEVITKDEEHVQRLEKCFKNTRKEDPQNYFPLNATGI